jgi:chemotaxis protein MotB
MASISSKLQPVIIKRVRKSGHRDHHGGAWKIAYADFVTAMMAFFLLMWLLGSTAQGDLQGIASYFQSPLKVALAGGSGSGDSSSVIKGGGTNLARINGNVKRGENDVPNRSANLQALRAEVEAADAKRLRRVQGRIEQALQGNPALTALRQQIRMDMTSDGLRIQIVDGQGRAMFDAGSAQVKDYMRELLRSIGRLVDDADAQVYLSGHTDASPYSGGERGYSNWELSADRANASRRELLAGGLGEERVVRVLGLGSSVPFDPNDPLSPLNRRISILVLGQLGRERWQGGAEMPVTDTQALERILARREGTPPAAPKPPTSPGATP